MIGEGRLEKKVDTICRFANLNGNSGTTVLGTPCNQAYQRAYQLNQTPCQSFGSWAHGPPKGSVDESCEEREQLFEQNWGNVLLLWKAVEYCVEVSVFVE
ncbi:hypothetical protein M9H77_23082 [Catharanthus roseus]|uniref:Uncharacterized protein n=1 Tax=Catharanthus roseus TaxID=4058 RepID=A0ACC0ASA5_CATRO|nr:hypothetical protein M9H77_23082 [Catharanthus roseus]